LPIDRKTIPLTPKYQVVFPADIRKAMGLRPGEPFQVMHYGDPVALVPVRPLQSLRGLLKGVDTAIARKADRL
jgi:AbrB family looped-hinge helix DNA binding protein